MSLHAEYTNKLSIIEQFGEYTNGKDYINHIHLSETKAEHESCKEKYGKTPARLFYDAKVFNSPTILAHCVWVEDEDMDIFKEMGVTVAHCPASNMKLGSGFCNTYKLLQKGVNIGIGTDSAASNNGLDIMREMYLAALLPKGVNNQADIVTPQDVYKMATVNGAKALGLNDALYIEEGAKADLMLIDLLKPNMQPINNFGCIFFIKGQLKQKIIFTINTKFFKIIIGKNNIRKINFKIINSCSYSSLTCNT